MTTPTPDAKTGEIVKQFNDLHVVSIALQSGMIVGNNTEEECLKAYQRIEEWLTQTLTDPQANAEKDVLIDLLRYTLSDRNMSDELRIAKLKSFIQVRLPDYKNYLD